MKQQNYLSELGIKGVVKWENKPCGTQPMSNTIKSLKILSLLLGLNLSDVKDLQIAQRAMYNCVKNN